MLRDEPPTVSPLWVVPVCFGVQALVQRLDFGGPVSESATSRRQTHQTPGQCANAAGA